ncbi:hypothetical protein, partial [Photobacterium sanguinicancri]
MRIGTAFNQNMALKFKLKTVFTADFINLFGRKRQECITHVPHYNPNAHFSWLSQQTTPFLIRLTTIFNGFN